MIKTMAIKITEETYPIAVACLPDGFVHTKKKFVLGSYLIINDLQFPDLSLEGRNFDFSDEEEDDECGPRPPRAVRYNRLERGRRNRITLVNFWEPKKLFKKKFKIVGNAEDKTSFFEITRR